MMIVRRTRAYTETYLDHAESVREKTAMQVASNDIMKEIFKVARSGDDSRGIDDIIEDYADRMDRYSEISNNLQTKLLFKAISRAALDIRLNT